ncbi:MAG: F0F1 ATP synthase subunit B [Betaproteobacteria bacterium]|nr:MAG: F0F1 ATP synthase subunit B [Betaproteobacteria bacterium]TMG78086.1 MAG: F0F1 ATP synthase subunit B [Betaproteobacteria bacterium]
MNINLTLIAQALAFALFIWLTAKFIWPVLMRKIEERQKQIADGLAAGERGKQELEAAGKRAGEELAKARERVGEIIGSAEKRDAQMLDEAKAAARAEADRILAAARADIDQQVARAKETLREQVAALAVAGAEKILRREVNAQTHADLLGQLKREI